MKELLLPAFLLVFAGISLAEAPQIINPPRPTRKYKELLMLKPRQFHPGILESRVDVYYIFTSSKWHVRDLGEGLLYLWFKNPEKVERHICKTEKRDAPCSIEVVVGSAFLDNPSPSATLLKFLKAETKSIKSDSYALVPVGVKIPGPKPQKAKVVFTK